MFSRQKAINEEYKFGEDLVFGVELEMCVCDKNIEGRRCCDDHNDLNPDCCKYDERYRRNYFTKFLRDVGGITVEYLDDTEDKPTEYFLWFVTNDSSVKCNGMCVDEYNEKYHGIELISPVLEYNQTGVNILSSALTKLNENFNFEVNNTQGLHVNMSYYGQMKDVVDKDYSRILRVFEAWFYYEPDILNLLPKSRLEGLEKFATPLNERYKRGGFKQFVDDMDRHIDLTMSDNGTCVWPTKYSAINLKKDRFEVRIPPPSMNEQTILSWVNFCLLFLNASLSKNPRDSLDLADFIGDDRLIEFMEQNKKELVEDKVDRDLQFDFD